MFDISWGELVLIGMVALVVIGPKELPTVIRTIGQMMTKVRRMASEFQGQFQEAMREAEFADLKKEMDGIADPARDFTAYNPLETARKEMEGAFETKPAATQSGEPPVTVSEPTSVPEAASASPALPLTPDAGGELVEPLPTAPSNEQPQPAAQPAETGGGKAA